MKFRAISFAFVMSMLGIFNSAQAGPQKEVDNMLGTMTAVTAPQARINSAQRGVLTGGSLNIKGRVQSINLVSYTPGGIKAGCSGVSLWGGSFSFINADQLITTLRTIASNAGGYMFKIALSEMCKTCDLTITQLQDWVNNINSRINNTCEVATGLVDMARGDDTSLAAQNLKDAFKMGSEGGSDVIETNFASDDSPSTAVADAGIADPCGIGTNILWCQLKRNNAAVMFGADGDDEMLQLAMSMFGTIVVHPATTDAATDSDTNKIDKMPSILTPQNLIDGASLEVYGCGADTTNCMAPDPGTITFKGLSTRIQEIFENSGGIIDKFSGHTTALTTLEKNVLGNLPSGYGAMVQRLSGKNPEWAKVFVAQIAEQVATEYISVFYTDMRRIILTSMANNNSSFMADWKEQFDVDDAKNQQNLVEQRAKIGANPDVIQRYNDMLQAIPPKYQNNPVIADTVVRK